MLRIKQTQGLGNSVLSSDPSYSDTMARQLMNTDAEILKSRNVVEPVINEIAGDSSKLPTYEGNLLKIVLKQSHIRNTVITS